MGTHAHDIHDTDTPPTASTGNGLLLVISGPSGVGKTTIAHAVERSIPAARFSVSYTTRPRTNADREGVDYHFVSVERFCEMQRSGDLLESAEVFGNWYGTGRAWVLEQMAAGALVILEIDVEGGKQIRQHIPEMYGVFIMPPTEEELLRRLRARDREDEGTIQTRFAEAKREMAEAISCNSYDAFIVNRELKVATHDVVGLVRGRLQLAAHQ